LFIEDDCSDGEGITFDRNPMGLDDPFDFSVNLHPYSYKCGEDPRKNVFNEK